LRQRAEDVFAVANDDDALAKRDADAELDVSSAAGAGA
jgi:hypothetical protein